VLSYRIGDPGRPHGHALLFFRDADDPEAAWATYLVVAPIALDLSKYIPAAFAPQLPIQMVNLGSMAYPLPPIPEKVEGGLAALERLAELRGDDLLDGGTVRVADPWQVMHPVAEIGREYAERYAEYVAAAPAESAPAPSLPTVDVDELLLQVMPDREKVGRLARLVGTLRYAVDGGDERLVRETVAKMESIGRKLGEKYRSQELIAAARSADPRAGQLAQLYVERCYRLADEDYAALAELDERISQLRSGDSADQS
jgi:hypothetical protein